jgi:hypothetical protein
MILNAYAVLDGFLAILRLGLGLLVIFLALATWRARRRRGDEVIASKREERGTLLFLAAFALVGLAIVSWPVFYLLLQSYIPEWPGVMCIYGVTQIGAGSVGTARFLPDLLRSMQLLKPTLVFVGGAWLILHLLNGRTATAPLAGRALLALLAVGVLATGDAVAELAYLLVPKKEEFVTAGCCTQAFDGAERFSRFLPHALVEEPYRHWLNLAYFWLNGGMVAALFVALRLGWMRKWLVLLAVLLAASIVLNLVFLIETAAPALLRLPLHHCPYDLLPEVPECTVTIGLFVLGSFAVGWACVAAWLGRHRETETLVPPLVAKLLSIGLFGYLGSLVMMALELALARAR